MKPFLFINPDAEKGRSELSANALGCSEVDSLNFNQLIN